jgi:hypothetical protein
VDESSEKIEAVTVTLEAGAAIFAIPYTGGTATVLKHAVARCGGRLLADEPADARALRAGRPAAARGCRLRAAGA